MRLRLQYFAGEQDDFCAPMREPADDGCSLVDRGPRDAGASLARQRRNVHQLAARQTSSLRRQFGDRYHRLDGQELVTMGVDANALRSVPTGCVLIDVWAAHARSDAMGQWVWLDCADIALGGSGAGGGGGAHFRSGDDAFVVRQQLADFIAMCRGVSVVGAAGGRGPFRMRSRRHAATVDRSWTTER